MESIIYNIIEKERLSELIDSFYGSIEIPIHIIDENGTILEHRGQKPAYCRHFINYLDGLESCSNIHISAGYKALELGESYIFSCKNNLTHIAFPLVSENTLFGSVIVGPFLMGDPDSTLVLDVQKRYSKITNEQLMQLYDDSFDLPIVAPSKVTHISRMMCFLFSNLIHESRERFIINQQKVEQQSRISEAIHMYKTGVHTEGLNYPFIKEQQLLAKVKEGNIDDSRSILNDILGYLLLSGGNDIDKMRNRSVEICSMLSRTAINSGASQKEVFTINDHFLSSLNKYTTIDEICHALEEVLSAYINCMFPIANSSGNTLIRTAMNFIASNFTENITLSDAAKEVSLNENYFSRLFHSVSGMTFKDYLTNIRIEEAKRLLKNTEFPLLEIAIATGFSDQSYFSKVFKAATGISPSKYRNQ